MTPTPTPPPTLVNPTYKVFRKYLWFALRERRFDGEAVADLVALRAALGLSDDEARGRGGGVGWGGGSGRGRGAWAGARPRWLRPTRPPKHRGQWAHWPSTKPDGLQPLAQAAATTSSPNIRTGARLADSTVTTPNPRLHERSTAFVMPATSSMTLP